MRVSRNDIAVAVVAPSNKIPSRRFVKKLGEKRFAAVARFEEEFVDDSLHVGPSISFTAGNTIKEHCHVPITIVATMVPSSVFLGASKLRSHWWCDVVGTTIARLGRGRREVLPIISLFGFAKTIGLEKPKAFTRDHEIGIKGITIRL